LVTAQVTNVIEADGTDQGGAGRTITLRADAAAGTDERTACAMVA
jgi:hypothetical protein